MKGPKTVPATSTDGSGDIVSEIESHVLKAVNELIRRAYADGDNEPHIADRKEEIVAMRQGAVQDCEFGLMVLTVHDWLGRRQRLAGELASREKVKGLVAALVQRTLKRITANSLDFRGGELKGSPVFFSGEPYSWSRYKGNDSFSANLDAAMLITAFLAAALEEFSHDFSITEFDSSDELKKRGIKTIHDATLLACTEGLLYANKCKVYDKEHFVGYTCDPGSNMQGSSSMLDEYDRLFFSWTTCETVHELSDWMPYLESLDKEGSAPIFLRDTKALLEELRQDLKAASVWCRQTFLDRFRSLEVPQVNRIVSEFAKLGQNEAPSADLDKERERLAEYVTHVYHLSQYAAIRSIEPVDISVREVRDVVTLLDTIVGHHILSSGLDAATHPKLFQSLTRYYSLGSSSKETYKDDAYFPLVVRSLSGLLTRTITALGTVASRDEVAALVLEFRRSLRSFARTLIDRRPENLEDGDENLWSFVAEGPYVLYATQRTVFSLIEYVKFIQAMEEFERPVSRSTSIGTIEVEIRDLLAKSMADVIITPVLEKFVRNASGLQLSGATFSLPGVQCTAEAPLPEPVWARAVVTSWLNDFTKDFQRQNLQEKLPQFALVLVRIRGVFNSSKRRSTKTGAQIEKAHAGLKEAMENIFSLPGVGPKLRKLDEEDQWETDALLPPLFEHLFNEFVKSGRPLSELATVEGNNLWSHIDEALGIVKVISQASATN